MTKNVVYKHSGHRSRLRQRFLQSGLEGFLDYEILELLLTLGTPRKDCKQVAKSALKKFSNLKSALDASGEELQAVKGIGPSNIFGLKLFQAVSERYSKALVPNKIDLSSSILVANYLQKNIGKEKKEHFVVLYLDSRNHLMKISKISVGSLTNSVAHPREVFKEALQISAAQIIVAHNHPSSDPNPSPEDIALTRRLWESSKILGVELLDHIIVTNDKYYSLKENNLV